MESQVPKESLDLQAHLDQMVSGCAHLEPNQAGLMSEVVVDIPRVHTGTSITAIASQSVENQ